MYYLHENPPGERHIYTTPTITVTNSTVTITDIEGYPVAVRWYVRSRAGDEFHLVKTCGEVPDPIFLAIFSDGFESGDTGRWSLEVGE